MKLEAHLAEGSQEHLEEISRAVEKSSVGEPKPSKMLPITLDAALPRVYQLTAVIPPRVRR